MTDAEKTDRLARVLWWAHWDGQPPYEWEAEPGRATDWRNAATAALTWLDSLEDDAPGLIAERDALRAEVARLRDATNQSRLAFAGLVCVRSAINKLDALGDTHA